MARGRLRIGYGSNSSRSLHAEYGQYNFTGQQAELTYFGGSAGPALGDSNISFSGSDIAVINPSVPAIIDGRIPFTDQRSSAIELGGVERLASYEYVEGGGFYGQGTARFVPGRFVSDPVGNPRGDHPGGIGHISGFGQAQVLTIGILWRHGPTLLAESDGIKSLIVYREGDEGQNERPMIIPKGAWNGGGTVVLPPCDGTECNAREDYGAPDGEDNFFNDPPIALPDISDSWPNPVHVWTEASIDFTASPYNIMHVRSYFSDGTELGTHVLKKNLWRDTGGYSPGLDVIGYYNSVDSPTAGCYLEIEYVEIHLGTFGPITPPLGFPGSAR